MATKVAVVTGANKGIGFGIVRGLSKRFQGVVYLTSRNEERGTNAVEELNQEGLNPKYHKLDITVRNDIEVFHDHIRKEYGGIDILVNNACIAFKKNSITSAIKQAERTLHVNYFSLLTTCEILFPLLRNGARVVNISSSLGHLSQIPSKEIRTKLSNPDLTVAELSELMQQYIEATKQGNQLLKWGYATSYAVSKVAVTALTKIQQKMVNDKDIKVNAVHPGYVATNTTAYSNLSIDKAAAAPLYLALDADDSIRGQYVWSDNRIVDWDGEMPTDN